MPRRYKNSPILEAACGFHFQPEASWNTTIPGLLYERLRKRFPNQRQVMDYQAMIAAGQNSARQPVVQQQVLQQTRSQFVREDGKALVQVSPNFLSVNHLAPYPTWNEFSPIVKQGLKEYRKVAAPKGLLGVQLHYLNQIVIPNRIVEIEEWFKFHFVLPEGFGTATLPMNGFLIGAQFPFENARDLLKMELSQGVSEDPNSSVFLLQITYEVAQQGGISLEQVNGWLTNAHRTIEKAFEGCIKDELRALFGEEKI